MTRKKRAFKALAKRILKRHEMNQKRNQKDADEINEFLLKYGAVDNYDLLYNDDFQRAYEGPCFHGAWLYDRIQDKIAYSGGSDYRGSMTKKIRKALGYNI